MRGVHRRRRRGATKNALPGKVISVAGIYCHSAQKPAARARRVLEVGARNRGPADCAIQPTGGRVDCDAHDVRIPAGDIGAVRFV